MPAESSSTEVATTSLTYATVFSCAAAVAASTSGDSGYALVRSAAAEVPTTSHWPRTLRRSMSTWLTVAPQR